MVVLIKRYANRKLYNTQSSRYITLKGIGELVEEGKEVRVVDNETGEDITSVTLSQVLVDTERNNRGVPGTLLSELIQRGGDVLYSALRKGVAGPTSPIGEIQRNVRRFIGARERDAERLQEWVALATPDLEGLVQRAVEGVMRALDLPRRSDIEALSQSLDRVVAALELQQRDARPASAQDGEPPARSEPS
ncbi:MAG: polyhydroxyalkanoate synthesis regulator DNA-binding domain-containing protein [Deltaproteobacteria bacterium]|nr:polyhydroxyalkanoate synthesis regulator DNA-binding domain-containing protein [Deltaproteobacteria bacterium]